MKVKVHPETASDSEKIDSTFGRSATDPNQNILQGSPHHKTNFPSTARNDHGDADDNRIPIESLLKQRQGTHTEVTIHQPRDDRHERRLWTKDVFIFGEPCSILTIIRLLQLLIVNLAIFILPWITVVQESVQKGSVWDIIVSLGAHSLLYVVEESTLYEFPPEKRNSQLYYAILISVLYASSEIYLGLISSVMYFDKYVTSVVVLIITVLYLADHWYSRAKAIVEAQMESATAVKFDGITRPETTDQQLNIGPQLVHPIPEEFSMPGNPEIS